MRQTSTGPGWYEIRLQGRLDARWATRFDGMTLRAGSDGCTVIDGPVVDQAALFGVLDKLRNLGLPLVSVTRVENDPDSHSPLFPDEPHQGD